MNGPDQSASFSRGKRPRRRLAFRLIAIALGVLPIVLLEVGLRVAGVAKPDQATDTLSGFNRNFPLFERDGDVFRTLRSREPLFNPQQFLAEKPKNGFRAFCFGGSTVFGHPYQWETAFPKWLQLELAAADPSRVVEVINCGGVSYASYRLAPIVREVLQHQPDLIVLAMGHNEFLEDRTYQPIKQRSAVRAWVEDTALSLHVVNAAKRIFTRREPVTVDGSARPRTEQLPAEVDPRLDDSRTGYASYRRDDEWRRQVIAQFRDTQAAMLEWCRAAKVPVIIVTLGSNLRDCPPFKSEHRADLDAEAERRWQAEYDAGKAAESSNIRLALEHFRKAEAIDAQHAMLLYRIGRCLDWQGQFAEAKKYFLRAKDEDICPLRMVDEVYAAQKELAAKTGTPLVDIRTSVETASSETIPGNDFYLDHVHPTIGVHQQIAAGVAKEVMSQKWFAAAKAWSEDDRRHGYARHFESLPASYIPNGRRRVEWLDNWSRRNRAYEETLPKDARSFLHAGFRWIELGALEDAWKAMDTALLLRPEIGLDVVERANQLFQEGRKREALETLDRLRQLKLTAEVRSAAEAATKRIENAR